MTSHARVKAAREEGREALRESNTRVSNKLTSKKMSLKL